MLQKVAAGQTAVSVTTAMSLAQTGRSIVVNTAGTAGLTQPFQTINKRVGQAVASHAAASNAQLIATPITVSYWTSKFIFMRLMFDNDIIYFRRSVPLVL